MPRRILLVGMMGAGKSTVGSLLARRLRYPYMDSDEQVERNAGASVADIFARRGEAAFRAEERKALAQAVTSAGPVVVSVAGGAVLDPDNRHRLRQAGTVVWLRARVSTLADRVGDGHGRPLLDPDPRAALARLYEQRRPLYQQVADVVVDVDDLTPEEVVEAVLEALAAPSAGDRRPGPGPGR